MTEDLMTQYLRLKRTFAHSQKVCLPYDYEERQFELLRQLADFVLGYCEPEIVQEGTKEATND